LKILDIESKVVGVCTDSGSDIKKAALEIFNQRFVCLAHYINLTISKGKYKIKTYLKKKIMRYFKYAF
jgi:hypothetical protein